jgi:hypothetical protein
MPAGCLLWYLCAVRRSFHYHLADGALSGAALLDVAVGSMRPIGEISESSSLTAINGGQACLAYTGLVAVECITQYRSNSE